MKIIVRDRKKQIQVSNITSKEEMAWITPEKFTAITSDAGEMATEFMKKHPQIHEVKFSVLPQLDEEEDEEEFYSGEDEDGQPRVIIIGEEQLQEDVSRYALQYPDDHWTIEQLRERLAKAEDISEGMEWGDSVCTDDPDTCYTFKCYCLAKDVKVFQYLGICKC